MMTTITPVTFLAQEILASSPTVLQGGTSSGTMFAAGGNFQNFSGTILAQHRTHANLP
jgi:hypothetical protein